jgi:hypothetical protein
MKENLTSGSKLLSKVTIIEEWENPSYVASPEDSGFPWSLNIDLQQENLDILLRQNFNELKGFFEKKIIDRILNCQYIKKISFDEAVINSLIGNDFSFVANRAKVKYIEKLFSLETIKSRYLSADTAILGNFKELLLVLHKKNKSKSLLYDIRIRSEIDFIIVCDIISIPDN